MFEKDLWKSDIFSKDAGHRHVSLLEMSPLPHAFFKDFASKNQLPSLSIIGTLVENGLKQNKKKTKPALVVVRSKRHQQILIWTLLLDCFGLI